MTNQEALELKTWLYEMKELRNENNLLVDNLCDLFGSEAFDSPVIENGYKYCDVAVKLAEKYFGDTNDWISWFMYDNEFGENGYEATIDDSEVKIDSIESFVIFFMEFGDETD